MHSSIPQLVTPFTPLVGSPVSIATTNPEGPPLFTPQFLTFTRTTREWLPMIRTAPAATDAPACMDQLQLIVRSLISKKSTVELESW